MTKYSCLGIYLKKTIFCQFLYGLGARSVDTSLNNSVALHYESKYMSWLHSMWRIGATIGPYIMGYALTNNNWNAEYIYINNTNCANCHFIF